MDHTIQKRYSNHKGLDLRSSDLTRPIDFACRMNNAQYRASGEAEKRKGYHANAASVGGFGQFVYRRFDPTTGADVSEVLSVDKNLHRFKRAQLTISYSGTSANVSVTFYLDATSRRYKLDIVDGATTLLSFDAGVGVDETSPLALSDMVTAINAITNFSASVSGSSATLAAFVKPFRPVAISSTSPVILDARYSEQVNSTVTDPLTAFYAKRNDPAFENASAVNIQNCIYFGTGYCDVMKYDGQTFYRAGLPKPAVSSAIGAAGAITGSNYMHKVHYTQWDAAGNLVEGTPWQTAVISSVTAQKINVTVSNVQAGTGFNTNCAIIAGAQATVNTITVDDGSGGQHTMKVGDTAYFFDAVSAAYVERKVTAISGTTITVAGAAVTVADNAVISNNLRISIWRNANSAVLPSTFNLVEEIPNNSFAATTVYSDNKPDGSLGELFIAPATDRSPPLPGKYVSQWNGQMIVAGFIDDPTSIRWSDIDSPEYHPADSNQIFHDTLAGDPISGIAPNNEVFIVMGDNSFGVLSGDLPTAQIRYEVKAQDVGCMAHSSIQELNGVLYWLSGRGPRCSTGGQLPAPVGMGIDEQGKVTGFSRIDPAFDNTGKADLEQFKTKRAIALIDRISEHYILFVPAESALGSDVYANANSRAFTYDKNRDAWLSWSNINMAGGAVQFGTDVFFQERRYSNQSGTITSFLWRRHNLEDAYDYADHTDPIGGSVEFPWEYVPQWEALGEPSGLKKFLELNVFNIAAIANNDWSLRVRQEANFQADVVRADFTLATSSAGYGQAAYSDAPYGDPAAPNMRHKLARARIRAIRLLFSNDQIHQNVIIPGWELECVTPYRPEIKS